LRERRHWNRKGEPGAKVLAWRVWCLNRGTESSARAHPAPPPGAHLLEQGELLRGQDGRDLLAHGLALGGAQLLALAQYGLQPGLLVRGQVEAPGHAVHLAGDSVAGAVPAAAALALAPRAGTCLEAGG
jgi:hypothetical protein